MVGLVYKLSLANENNPPWLLGHNGRLAQDERPGVDNRDLQGPQAIYLAYIYATLNVRLLNQQKPNFKC